MVISYGIESHTITTLSDIKEFLCLPLTLNITTKSYTLSSGPVSISPFQFPKGMIIESHFLNHLVIKFKAPGTQTVAVNLTKTGTSARLNLSYSVSLLKYL